MDLMAKRTVRELEPGDSVDLALLVKARVYKEKKQGGEYMGLTAGDRTGELDVKVWDGVPDFKAAGAFEPGSVVVVQGKYNLHEKYGPEVVKLTHIRQARDGEYDMNDLLDGPDEPVEQIEQGFRWLVESVDDLGCKALLEATVGDVVTWQAFRVAPAAKGNHHNYRHGLIEHTTQVAQAVHALCGTFPEVDGDLAVTGALLHDIGKLDTYNPDPLAIDYTRDAHLVGEIPLSYYRVRRALEELPTNPAVSMDKAWMVLHMIASHHGIAAHGATASPATPEALLVHYVDNLSARMGAWAKAVKDTPKGEAFSGYSRALGGRALIPEES